ncbi:MAG: LysM peptidoglycan-binding domain-containing protein [Rhizobiaceae bacterium]
MRSYMSGRRIAVLKRGTALILLGSLAAGCSSDVSRFSDTRLFTNSTSNQRAIIEGETNQPYPGDVIEPASTDGTYTGSVNREALKPVDLTQNGVDRSELKPVKVDRSRTEREVSRSRTDANSKSMLEPAGSVRNTDPIETGTVKRPVEPDYVKEDENGKGGWTATGGTRVTVRRGETLYNLSRRFGVPVKAIMKVNGIKNATSVKAGSEIVIPTYVYSRSAPISAPDNHPKVAKANSGRGEKTDDSTRKAPKPEPKPDREAVLPATAKTRDRVTVTASDESRTASKTAAKGATHKVVSGDTLYDIARKYGTTTDRLKNANGLTSGLIRVGQKLKIPAAGETVVADAPDGIDPIATGTAGPAVGKSRKTNRLPKYTPPVKKQAGELIKEAKATVTDTPDDSGIGKMRWPARGRVISAYGKVESGRKNDGIDIALPSGSAVKAAENGVVIYAGDGLKEFGNTVLVRHEDGVVTVYGHASSLSVKRGDKVKRGQEIAKSGMSGSADVPKLHFEVREKSVPVNPMTYLQ